MATEQAEQRFDAAAYLAWEETRAERHEHLAGEVLAMVGVRQSHNVATPNLATALRTEPRGSRCRVFSESVKARGEAADRFFCPDVLVTCNPRNRLTPAYVSHPLPLAELLSQSTAAFDRGGRFAAYRKLASLQEYVLIDIAARRVEAFRRDPENHWLLHDHAPGDSVAFASLARRLPVEQLLEDTDEGYQGDQAIQAIQAKAAASPATAPR